MPTSSCSAVALLWISTSLSSAFMLFSQPYDSLCLSFRILRNNNAALSYYTVHFSRSAMGTIDGGTGKTWSLKRHMKNCNTRSIFHRQSPSHKGLSLKERQSSIQRRRWQDCFELGPLSRRSPLCGAGNALQESARSLPANLRPCAPRRAFACREKRGSSSRLTSPIPRRGPWRGLS